MMFWLIVLAALLPASAIQSVHPKGGARLHQTHVHTNPGDETVPKEKKAKITAAGTPEKMTPMKVPGYNVTTGTENNFKDLGEIRLSVQHTIHGTPDPITPSLPGIRDLQFGWDSSRGILSEEPVFEFTYMDFKFNEQNLGLEEKQFWDLKNKEIFKIPDTVTVLGPLMECEKAAEKSSHRVSTSSEVTTEQEIEAKITAEYTPQVKAVTKAVPKGTEVPNEESEEETGGVTSKGEFSISDLTSSYNKDAGDDFSEAIITTIMAKTFTVSISEETPVSEHFLLAVQELYFHIAQNTEEDASVEPLHTFWMRYGTHYITAATLGGRLQKMTTFKKGSLTDAKAKSESVSSGIAINTPVLAFSSTSTQSKSSSTSEQKDEEMRKHQTTYTGGEPNKNWMEWCASTIAKPAVVQRATESLLPVVIRQFPQGESAKNKKAVEGRLRALWRDTVYSRCGCLNGGTCAVLENGTVCECPSGFFGEKCEVTPLQTVSQVSGSVTEGTWTPEFGYFTSAEKLLYHKGPIIEYKTRYGWSAYHLFKHSTNFKFASTYEGETKKTVTWTKSSTYDQCGEDQDLECSCPTDQFITGVACVDQYYCDSLKISCGILDEKNGKGWKFTGNMLESGTVGSTEGKESTEPCPGGSIAVSIQCKDSNCRYFNLKCKKIMYVEGFESVKNEATTSSRNYYFEVKKGSRFHTHGTYGGTCVCGTGDDAETYKVGTSAACGTGGGQLQCFGGSAQTTGNGDDSGGCHKLSGGAVGANHVVICDYVSSSFAQKSDSQTSRRLLSKPEEILPLLQTVGQALSQLGSDATGVDPVPIEPRDRFQQSRRARVDRSNTNAHAHSKHGAQHKYDEQKNFSPEEGLQYHPAHADARAHIGNLHVDLQQVINDTPDPVAPSVPGIKNMQYGWDRNRDTHAMQRIFKWTYSRFQTYEQDLGYERNSITMDGMVFKVPDHLELSGPLQFCEQAGSTSTKVIESESDMETALSSETSISGDTKRFAGSYSASQDLKDYKKSRDEGYSKALMVTSKARVFHAHLSVDVLLPLTEKFQADAKMLAAYGQKLQNGTAGVSLGDLSEKVFLFMSNFGTDYISEAVFGGRITKLNAYKENALTDAQTSSEQNSLAAEASFAGVGGGGKLKTGETLVKSSVTTENKNQYSTRFYGGLPGDFEDWCRTVIHYPVTVEKETKPIYELFTQINDIGDTSFLLDTWQRMTATRCQCGNGGNCNLRTGACECVNNFMGLRCEIAPDRVLQKFKLERATATKRTKWFDDSVTKPIAESAPIESWHGSLHKRQYEIIETATYLNTTCDWYALNPRKEEGGGGGAEGGGAGDLGHTYYLNKRNDGTREENEPAEYKEAAKQAVVVHFTGQSTKKFSSIRQKEVRCGNGEVSNQCVCGQGQFISKITCLDTSRWYEHTRDWLGCESYAVQCSKPVANWEIGPLSEKTKNTKAEPIMPYGGWPERVTRYQQPNHKEFNAKSHYCSNGYAFTGLECTDSSVTRSCSWMQFTCNPILILGNVKTIRGIARVETPNKEPPEMSCKKVPKGEPCCLYGCQPAVTGTTFEDGFDCINADDAAGADKHKVRTCPTKPRDYYRKSAFVGKDSLLGTTCTCPNGQQYEVGVLNDDMDAPACIGGVWSQATKKEPGFSGKGLMVSCDDGFLRV